MFTRFFTATLLTALSSWAYGDEYAVITAKYTGRALNVYEVKEKVALPPGLVVRTMSQTGTAYDGHFALIEDIDKSDGVIWVPFSALATQKSFSPLKKWKEYKFDVSAGDYLAHYHFLPDGTFSYRSYAENGKAFTIQGRLYKSKNILWAPRNVNKNIAKEDVFVVTPEGKICWAVIPEDCFLSVP